MRVAITWTTHSRLGNDTHVLAGSVGEDGRYRACGVPVGVALGVRTLRERASGSVAKSPVVHVRLPASGIRRLDLEAPGGGP
ncbi:MAG TPA: hypothetical protein VFQ38_06690 [Longimicrobiales bacterium]|nr:hypothetical protein [Longimicrobiales bacterium]